VARSLLRLPAVRSKTGLSTSKIYEGQDEGWFPHSVAIGERAVAWVDEEVDAWVELQIANRDAQSQSQPLPKARRGGPGRGHRGPMKMIETTGRRNI
jgi:prophage regulatory protein